MSAAIFLDRDGVIIENRANYVRSWADVVFLPNAFSSLQRISDKDIKIVIVTNQSGIGRGLIEPSTAEAINSQLVSEIQRRGGRIDGIYMCPHKPADQCDCRKPEPGLLQKAALELKIDLSQSIMIGDALTDLQAGHQAGVSQVALVRTGRGNDQANLPEATTLSPYLIYDDLAAALTHLLP